MSDCLEMVRRVLVALEIPSEKISVEASLSKDLSIDSTEFVEILIALEEETKVQLDERELKDVRTVGELAAFVESQLVRK